MYLVCKDNPKFEETSQLIQAAKDLGIVVVDAPYDLTKPSFFLYGTRDFVLPYVNHKSHIFSKQEYIYDYSFLDSIGINTYLFNQRVVYDTAQNVSNHLYLNSYKSGIFIRPVSGNKQFHGQVLDKRTVQSGIVDLFQISPWEMVVIAEVQEPPEEEYRFFCLKKNDKISILGCRYLPEESLNIDRQIIFYVENMASKIFEKIPFGDSFVMDIAVSVCGYKTVIELNSWNSSSFYSIDPKTLLGLIFKC